MYNNFISYTVMHTMQFYLFLLLILGTKGVITEGRSVFDNIIYVNQTGNNDQSCWKGNYWNPCSSVNLALQGIKNRTAIYIQKGNYNLTNDNATNLTKLSHIGIIGNDSADEVVIHCEQNAGLSFIYSDNIEVRSLSLVKCGAMQFSTSKNFLVKNFEFVRFRVALYVLLCIHATIENVHIESSFGTGLVLYNTAGNVRVSYSNINNSKPWPQSGKEVGAGGLHIEFTYCIPGNTECRTEYNDSYVPTIYSSNSTYFIHNNNIQYNKASLGVYSTLYKVDDEHAWSIEFGAGGGLSVILKGIAKNNMFVIYNNTFSYNHAIYGGGFYVSFLDSATNNSIFMCTLNCLNNNASSDSDQKRDTWYTDGGGGCGKIVIYSSPAAGKKSNNVSISNSIFSNNIGLTGGGIEIEVDYVEPITIELNNVTFLKNSAFLGAAMYVVEKKTISEHNVPFNLSINNSKFLSNTPICKLKSNSFTMLPCSGVIYLLLYNMNLTIQGELMFVDNGASALEIHSFHVYFAPQSKVTFENNTSDFGGAIALYDCSYLMIDHNVTILFLNNSAQYEGGAIYAEKCRSNQPTSLCFIQNNDIGENFTFIGNTAGGKPNAIYTGSVIPCYASSGWKPTFWDPSVLKDMFCWDYFHFGDSYNCTLQRKSDPVFMEILQHSQMKVYPGISMVLPIAIYDGWNTSLQNISLLVCVYSGPVILHSQQSQQLADCVTTMNKEITIFLNDCFNYNNHNFELKISLSDNTQFSTRLPLDFPECPKPLLTINKQCSQCTFSKTLPHNSLHCSSLSNCGNNIDSGYGYNDSLPGDVCNVNSYLYMSAGWCVSIENDNSNKTDFVVSNCPPYYLNRSFCIPILNLTDSCSNTMSGRLCGKCKHGRIAVNSPSLQCGKCHELSGLIFFCSQIVPLTIFILLILVFHITITSPGMNAFIFFSQVVTLDFPGTMYPSWIRDSKIISNNLSPNFGPLMLPYSIWNMNFIFFLSSSDISVCITTDMDTVEVVGFQYVIALYPLVVLLLLYIWNRFYENGVRPIHYITRPIHQILARMWQALEITPSLMDSCAVIFIISFTKITLTSLKLLHYTTWYSLDGSKHGAVFYYDGSINYFQAKHLGFGAAAIVFLLIFVACPVIYFLLYPCMWFQKLLDKCKVRYHGLVVISDIFMGTFRDRTMSSFDYRYCAGLYLLFRIICICLYYITNIQVLLIIETGFSLIVAGFFMICRPYKRNINNLIDFSVFLLLSILSGLCLAESRSHLGLRISAGLLFVPFIVFSIYILYLLLKRVKLCATKCFIHKRQINNVNPDYEQNSDEEPLLDDDHLTASFPDRIENPNRYRQQNQPNIPQPLSDNDSRSFSEATGYTPPTDDSTGKYGSIQYRPNKHSTI